MSHILVKRGEHEYKFHEKLSENLNDIIKNQHNDWDFKLLITGDGMTRTGKSTLAFQIAQYIDPTFAENWKTRVIFDGKKLIETAYKIEPKKVLVYDEAREGLDNKKQMQRYTKNILDFFSQCGNLNHVILIVMPDFFELPKTIALTQSVLLINCHTQDGFRRGYFEFYNRVGKKFLYIKGTKFLDYKAQWPDFKGTFVKYSIVPKIQYENLKSKTLQEAKKNDNFEEVSRRSEMHKERLRVLIQKLIDEGFTSKRVADMIGVSKSSIFNTYLKKEVKVKG